jgi:hypothetical protein
MDSGIQCGQRRETGIERSEIAPAPVGPEGERRRALATATSRRPEPCRGSRNHSGKLDRRALRGRRIHRGAAGRVTGRRDVAPPGERVRSSSGSCERGYMAPCPALPPLSTFSLATAPLRGPHHSSHALASVVTLRAPAAAQSSREPRWHHLGFEASSCLMERRAERFPARRI